MFDRARLAVLAGGLLLLAGLNPLNHDTRAAEPIRQKATTPVETAPQKLSPSAEEKKDAKAEEKKDAKGEEKKDAKAEEKKLEPPPPPADPVQLAEQLLKDAKIDAATPALLEFFKIRTLSEAERRNLTTLIAKLGSDDFDVRQEASEQLSRAGLAALPTLRASNRSDDAEVVRRVELCLGKLRDINESARVCAAALLLADRGEARTPRVLLDYLPCVPDDEGVAEGMRLALVRYSRRQPAADAALLEALSSPEAATRALAAQVLGEAVPAARPQVRKSLADPDARVRYFAGITLLRQGEREVMGEFLKLLSEGPVEYAYLAEDAMFQILGDGKVEPTLSEGKDDTRKRVRASWEKWWAANGAKADLARLNDSDAVKGLTLIVEVDQVTDGKGGQGRIWECGPDGKLRWEWTNVNGPVEIQALPNGRYLLAEYYNQYVTVRDRTGAIVWTSPKMGNSTVSAQRLANGNTLIATMSEVVEVDPAGQKVGDPFPRPQGTVYQVKQAKNGNTFILAGNELMEVGRNRKELRKVAVPGGLSGWAGFDFLPNGNFLIAYYGQGNKFAEIDATGKLVQETVTSVQPTRVQRLRNGNTLVAGGNSMNCIEYDAAKKEVFKVPTKGRPFSVLRY